jgi:hypothetical protein
MATYGDFRVLNGTSPKKMMIAWDLVG